MTTRCWESVSDVEEGKGAEGAHLWEREWLIIACWASSCLQALSQIPKRTLAGEYHCFCEHLKTQTKIRRIVWSLIQCPMLHPSNCAIPKVPNIRYLCDIYGIFAYISILFWINGNLCHKTITLSLCYNVWKTLIYVFINMDILIKYQKW